MEEIVSLLELCLNATYFTFKETHYRQCFGTAMGSPVSVTVTNLVREEIEEEALCTFSLRPQFWKRYVDDTCTVLKKEEVDRFHEHLNGVNPIHS